jgi:DNA-directed RNA polymerase specialized sigma24 family protein
VPTKYRVPWVLSRVEGMTLNEVADASGWSVATIKRRIAQAEQRLKRMLDGY